MLRVLLLVAALALLGAGQDYDDVPDFDWDELTSLDEYVHRDDGHFSWSLIWEYEYDTATVYMLNMTSQKWTDETYASQSVWWHWVAIAVPHWFRSTEHAVLAIGGGSNRDYEGYPTNSSAENVLAAQIANETGIVTAYILMVPNQPIVFTNDPEQKDRSEDDIIAWTWRTYLDNDVSPEVILRHPMTKAAKRGLDTINEFVLTVNPEINIDKFIPTGASKRGWTTWSLGAVDQRVVGMIPLVFSLLNIDDSIMAHYQALDGGWSFAFEPYYEVNLTQELHNPRTQDVWNVEDMFRFRSRLTMPKYLIVATGDEFFLNQDSHYWWDGMTEPMHMYMVGNAEHTLLPHYVKIAECIMAYVAGFVDEIPFPENSWERGETEDSGWVRMYTNPPPRLTEEGEYDIRAMRGVTLQNDTRRDYRLFAGHPDPRLHPVWWRAEDVTDEGDGTFYHETLKYEEEWVGHYLEGTWDWVDGHRLFLTTEVNIVPDTFPIEECYAEGCFGELV